MKRYLENEENLKIVEEALRIRTDDELYSWYVRHLEEVNPDSFTKEERAWFMEIIRDEMLERQRKKQSGRSK